MFDNARFSLEARPDGIYLSSSRKDFSEDEVLIFLTECGIVRYDANVLRKFLVDGETCKICRRSPEYEHEAKITVVLSSDKMTASVTIEPPFFTRPWPSVNNVLKALKDSGVKVGIDKSTIELMVQHKVASQAVTVAHGVPPIEGKDAYIELIKDPDKPFEVTDDDRIDFWSRSTIVTVHPGQEIAVKHPLVSGKNGLDVTGSPVKYKPVRNVEFSFGDGLEIDNLNPMMLVATAEGQLKNDKGKLVVLPELDINRDIDFGVGSIDFTGAVKIHGSVRDGFHVVAQGNIDIHGMVEGAYVDSQGVVVIHGGIRGVGKGTIRADGDISLGFCDQATIRAGGSILIKNASLHSKLYAQGRVLALGTGKSSQIAGGRIEAGIEVSCNILGSKTGTRTEVVVGVPPEQLEKRKVFTSEIRRCEDNLERIEPNLVLLKKMETEGMLDDKKRAMMMNLVKMKFQLQAALDNMKSELEALDEQLALARDNGIVRVKDICYEGVVISLSGLTYTVKEPCKYTSFIADEDKREIVLKPFNHNSRRRGG